MGREHRQEAGRGEVAGREAVLEEGVGKAAARTSPDFCFLLFVGAYTEFGVLVGWGLDSGAWGVCV